MHVDCLCFIRLGYRPIAQSANRSIGQSLNRLIAQSANRSIGQSLNRPIALLEALEVSAFNRSDPKKAFPASVEIGPETQTSNPNAA